MKKLGIIVAIVSVIFLGMIVPTHVNSEATISNLPVVESSVMTFQEEEYIDDIPFDTEEVVNEISLTKMEEEGYIDDIPFDTEKVVRELKRVSSKLINTKK